MSDELQSAQAEAGPHATPDQERAAAKRRAAAGLEQERTAPPAERTSPRKSTA